MTAVLQSKKHFLFNFLNDSTAVLIVTANVVRLIPAFCQMDVTVICSRDWQASCLRKRLLIRFFVRRALASLGFIAGSFPDLNFQYSIHLIFDTLASVYLIFKTIQDENRYATRIRTCSQSERFCFFIFDRRPLSETAHQCLPVYACPACLICNLISAKQHIIR